MGGPAPPPNLPAADPPPPRPQGAAPRVASGCGWDAWFALVTVGDLVECERPPQDTAHPPVTIGAVAMISYLQDRAIALIYDPDEHSTPGMCLGT